MTKHYYLMLALVGLLCMPRVQGQTVVSVSPGVGTLNQAIDDYVAANGDPDWSVIFQLESGGFYPISATLEHNFPLRIEAAPGYTQRPVIRPFVSAGGSSFRCFRSRGPLQVRGLYITNEDGLGGVEDQIIRISADSADVFIIDDCHLDKASQSALRLDNDWYRLFLTNSVFSNLYNLSDPNNGRGIDDRGSNIDTLWVENCTFYNLSSRIFRDDGGSINYAYIDHVTGYNLGDRVGDMGPVNEAIITNNFFVNHSFLGADSAGSTTWRIDSVDAGTQQIFISNNNFVQDTSLLDLLAAVNANPAANVTRFARENFDEGAYAFMRLSNTDSTVFGRPVAFVNVPPVPADFVTTFFDTTISNPAPIPDGNGGADPGETQLPFDFGYAAGPSVTQAATDGTQLGDLNWAVTTTTRIGNRQTLRQALALTAFPNPFAGTTSLRFELAQPATLDIRIWDVQGRLVQAFPVQTYGVGTHLLSWEAGHLPAGMYVAQVRQGSQIATISLRHQ